MAFSGFSRDIQDYFRGLSENNTREWFEDNRARFNDLVMEPSKDFVAAINPHLAALSPALEAVPKLNGSVRRIFRDTRFSKDKTPYHTYLHLIFWAGDHPNRAPGVHIILGAEHFGYGAGHWGFEADQIKRYRADIVSDGAYKVQAAIDAVTKDGGTLNEPALARIPSGIDRDADWAHWARHKGLVVRSGDLPYPDELFSPDAVKYVTDICRQMSPLTHYLVNSVYR